MWIKYNRLGLSWSCLQLFYPSFSGNIPNFIGFITGRNVPHWGTNILLSLEFLLASVIQYNLLLSLLLLSTLFILYISWTKIVLYAVLTSINQSRLVFECRCVCKRLHWNSHVLSAVPQTVAHHQSTRRITWVPSQVGCTTRNSSRYTFSCTFSYKNSHIIYHLIAFIFSIGCVKRSLQDYRR